MQIRRGGQAPSTPQEKIKGGSLRQLRPPSALQPPFFLWRPNRHKSGSAALPPLHPPQKKKVASVCRRSTLPTLNRLLPFLPPRSTPAPPRRICIRPPSVHYYPNHIFSTSLHYSPCLPASLLALLPLRPPPFRRLPPLPSALLPSADHLRRPPPPPTSAAYLRRPPPPPISAAHLRRPSPPPTSAALLMRRPLAIRADLARRHAEAQPVKLPPIAAEVLPFGYEKNPPPSITDRGRKKIAEN